ncbi:hypothetical protein LDENG_00095820, partial [Lucifuga dentata]
QNHLQNQPFLSPSNLERVIHALISSRLDDWNSLCHSIYQAAISHLQLIQNAAARLLTRSKKRDHVTPIISELLTPHSTTRTLRSTHRGVLAVPRSWGKKKASFSEQPAGDRQTGRVC